MLIRERLILQLKTENWKRKLKTVQIPLSNILATLIFSITKQKTTHEKTNHFDVRDCCIYDAF
jgi:hypothetical protein